MQSLRNQHDADIVVLLTDNVYPGILGRANEIRAEAPDAYAIVEVSAASGSGWTFVHEVGHLQGAQHDPGNACALGDPDCDFEGDLFPDAFGHFFTASGNLRRTVMASNRLSGYSRILYFSNPSVTYNGTATGTSSRDNADALQTTSDAVEYFRTSDRLEAKFSHTGNPNGGARSFDANPCGGTGSYSYEWRISYYGPYNYGSPVSTQEMFTHLFPEGVHSVKLTVTSGSQTDVAVVNVTIDCQPGYQCGSFRVAGTDATPSSEEALASLKSEETAPPEEVALHAATPNPVRTSTEIRYDLPETAEVELTVYDLMGREVRRLATGTHGQGNHRVRLDTATLPSGVYIVRLQDGRRQLTRRITVVK
ncbi:MAG: zinc-dependent metalloprotease [Rhodothermales bacterium]